ncbi:MAG: hypothetical protein JXA21_24460 [Anaerolineae bacterium]|nr:hypothetical protein [Anaerolineae bacterium]
MIDGTYDVTVETPMGALKGTVVLRQEGEALTGKFTIMGKEAEFSGGAITGNQCSFSGEMVTPLGNMPYTINGTVDGDTLAATAETQLLGKLAISGVRADAAD